MPIADSIRVRESHRLVMENAERTLGRMDTDPRFRHSILSGFACQNKLVGLSLERDYKVAYANGCDPTDIERRTRTTLGRFINRQCPGGQYLPPVWIDQFVGLFWFGALNMDEHIRLVTGEDITDAYENEIGGSSCMTGNRDIIDIYEENDDVVSLLIFDDGERKARALVWRVECPASKTGFAMVVDRIYPNSGSHISAIRAYASRRGWAMRKGTSLPKDGIVLVQHDNLDDYSKLSVVVDKTDNWPYMDTMRYASEFTMYCVRLSNKPTAGCITLSRIDGMLPGDELICESCGCDIDDDDYESLPNCVYCHGCCNFCDHCEEWCVSCLQAVDISSCHTEYWCECCRDHDSGETDFSNDYIDNDSLVVLHDGQTIAEWQLQENGYKMCGDCNEHVILSDEGVCPHCVPEGVTA